MGVPLVVILSGLAGLAALPGSSSGGSGNGADGNVIKDDVYFYGQSPSVYPSRKCIGERVYDPVC